MIYTKDTFNPKHIGLRVKVTYVCLGRSLNGILKEDKTVDLEQGDKEQSLWDCYELLPMPLKEAYDRGLLNVGQKVRYTYLLDEEEEQLVRMIDRIDPNGIWDAEGGLHEWKFWNVEILEEPKEETKPIEEKKEYMKIEPSFFNGLSFSTVFMDEFSKPTNEPTKPKTIMNYLNESRKAVKDLFIPEDIKLMRDAGWEKEPHVRTQEGTEALLDMLFEENRDKLIEKVKKIQADIDKDKSKE